MKKGGFLRNVLDTIRPNQQQQQAGGTGSGPNSPLSLLDCGGQLKQQHFALGQVARHGFPAKPSAFAYDPVQRIAAIGTSTGGLRVFGRPGVDAWAQHKTIHQGEKEQSTNSNTDSNAVTHLRFIVNQGALITVTADDGLHLWSLRGSQVKLQFSSSSSSSNNNNSLAIFGATSSNNQAKQQFTTDSESSVLTYDHTSGSHHQPNSENESQQNFNTQQLQILHTLKFKREHITCIHQTLNSKWLYVGTDRGNVHVINVETFQLSGYSIAWNKAIELSRKSHPGSIIHLSECPQDTNKLLIGFGSGCICLWDLKSRSATCRYFHLDSLLCLSWLHDGKQFVGSYSNGSLATWQTRSASRPAQVIYPHAKSPSTRGAGSPDFAAGSPTNESSDEVFEPIRKVEWRSSLKTNDSLMVFSGGLPKDEEAKEKEEDLENEKKNHKLPTSITVMFGKSINVLELERPIVDFTLISENSPHENESSEPSAAFVLLNNELLIIDLQTNGYPSFKPPYPSIRLADSPVTCIQYLADCKPELIALLCSHSSSSLKKALSTSGGSTQSSCLAADKIYSDRDWPIAGGEWDPTLQSYPEVVLTGHLDGSIKFWDMSGLNLDMLSSLKTSHLFEEPNWPNSNGQKSSEENSDFRENPFSIIQLEFCSNSSRLLVAGSLGQVLQFKLIPTKDSSNRKESTQNCTTEVILVETKSDQSNNNNKNNKEASNNNGNNNQQQKSRRHLVLKARKMVQSSSSSAPNSSLMSSKTVTQSSSSSKAQQRTGNVQQQQQKLVGFQPEIICLSPLEQMPDGNSVSLAPPKITALCYEPNHNILAYAHEKGIVLVDVIQKSVIISASLADLYGGRSLTPANDISIQPFATSSILQQHYQANSLPLSASSSTPTSTGNLTNNNNNNNNNDRTFHNGGGFKATSGGSRFSTQRNSNGDSGTKNESVQFEPLNNRPKSAASAFQRQLSTTALKSEQSSLMSSSSVAAAGNNTSGSNSMQGSRLFQRQMTASQLLSHSSDSPTSNKQRAAALLAAARGVGQVGNLESNLASSTSCLNTNSTNQTQTLSNAKSPRRNQPEVEDAQQQQQQRKPKGKRIISRMLSISTIHSSLGSNVTECSPSSGFETSSSSSAIQTNTTTNPMEQTNADKIDSSFTRSRSSSCSSDTSPRQMEPPQLSTGESIQCLCFLDWTRQQQQQQAGEQNSSSNSSGYSSSSHPTNNKSLGSIDGSTLQSSASQLTLWLGTSQGSILLLNLSMPDNDDNRVLQLESVEAEPIPQATIRMRGSIKCLSTFTSELIKPMAPSSGNYPPSPPPVQSASSSLEAVESPPASFESRKSPPNASTTRPQRQSGQSQSQTSSSSGGGGNSTELRSLTFLAIVSERQARIYQVPESSPTLSLNGTGKLLIGEPLNCVAKVNFSTPIHKAALMQMRQPSESCLATQSTATTTGCQLLVHSLPQLKVLNESQLDSSCGSSIVFGRNAHALYQPSPNEIAKFTLNAQYKALIGNMSSHLYVAREMPEVPRSNFFKSLLGSVGTSLTSKQCDRDGLFGGSGGSADSSSTVQGGSKVAQGPRALNKHIGSAGLDRLRGTTTGGLASEMRFAREGLDERGEKLSEIEDRTLQMMNQSENYSQTSHQLAQKYKDKKWYQF